MKILFLTDNFPPEVNAPATRTYEHCREWVKQGEDVTVITCHPNFPTGKIYSGYRNKFYSKEILDGIKVIRVWTYITANEGFFKRSTDYFSFGIMSFIMGLFIKTDIIIGTSPQFFTAMSARWLSFFKRKKWIMEVRDLWPESIAAVGALKKDSLLYKTLSWAELRMYKSASKIITVTNSFKSNLIDRKIEENKIFVVTNGVDLSNFTSQNKDTKLIDQYNLKDKFIIGYLGTLGLAHGLNFIVKAISKIDDKDIHFIIQGNGADKNNLLALAEELNLNNISFIPSVPKDQISRYISIIDVALVNLKKNDTFKTVIPSKIFENAAMQKPILLGVEGESKDIIESYNCGLTFDPENELDFLDKVKEIKTKALEKIYYIGCKNLANDFNRSDLAVKLLNILKQK